MIENTQRDLNIALMNEIAKICQLLDIRTRDVLAAAGTKWNFLKFHPGLVGGHCIGVDPYYLTAKAEQLGYQPEVILSGRRVNDGMGAYLAQRVMKMLAASGRPIAGARVGILGFTFKENVPDIRNSKVIEPIASCASSGSSLSSTTRARRRTRCATNIESSCRPSKTSRTWTQSSSRSGTTTTVRSTRGSATWSARAV